MRPSITHVLPTKDRFDYLATALERAKTWKRQDDELIVLDGSEHTDNRETVEQSELVDRYIVEPDRHICEALNKGLEIATYSIVRNVCDDDWYVPESIDKAAMVMAEYPTIALLACGGWRVWEPFPDTFSPMEGHAICVPRGENYGSHPHTILKWGACGAGFFHRKELALPYSNDYTMVDVDCALRHCAAGLDIRFLRVNLFTHVVYPHSTIRRDPDVIVRERKHFQERYGYVADGKQRSYQKPPVWDGEFA